MDWTFVELAGLAEQAKLAEIQMADTAQDVALMRVDLGRQKEQLDQIVSKRSLRALKGGEVFGTNEAQRKVALECLLAEDEGVAAQRKVVADPEAAICNAEHQLAIQKATVRELHLRFQAAITINEAWIAAQGAPARARVA